MKYFQIVLCACLLVFSLAACKKTETPQSAVSASVAEAVVAETAEETITAQGIVGEVSNTSVTIEFGTSKEVFTLKKDFSVPEGLKKDVWVEATYTRRTKGNAVELTLGTLTVVPTSAPAKSDSTDAKPQKQSVTGKITDGSMQTLTIRVGKEEKTFLYNTDFAETEIDAPHNLEIGTTVTIEYEEIRNTQGYVALKITETKE